MRRIGHPTPVVKGRTNFEPLPGSILAADGLTYYAILSQDGKPTEYGEKRENRLLLNNQAQSGSCEQRH